MNATTADQILMGAAETFRTRGKVYKDNYKTVGAVMAALFPEGITLKTPKDHERFHIFMLGVVKMSRYVKNWDKGHQDSVHDQTVYSAMLEMIDANHKATEGVSQPFKQLKEFLDKRAVKAPSKKRRKAR